MGLWAWLTGKRRSKETAPEEAPAPAADASPAEEPVRAATPAPAVDPVVDEESPAKPDAHTLVPEEPPAVRDEPVAAEPGPVTDGEPSDVIDEIDAPVPAMTLATPLTVIDLLDRIDGSRPERTGSDAAAREAFAAAEVAWAELRAAHESEADADALSRVEGELRAVADRLDEVGDPLAVKAWLDVADAVRLRGGAEEDVLAAYARALDAGPEDGEAWRRLLEHAGASPDVPTLTQLFRKSPVQARPVLMTRLIGLAFGKDKANPLPAGERVALGEALVTAADAQGDESSVAVLAGHVGLQAEKDGDLAAAVASWRRAVAAGNTNATVADRLTVWLVKQSEFEEAAQVIRQAMKEPPSAASVRDRLEKRLARCEKSLSA
ncbi:hypothetical protein [Rhizohabitans arisaemae]|uniref:hypothetical protein n=1 Tax=Rhizohabitans arisaemae TaxID=2720610 RepID=UPI0024B1FD25|nr:hypothetical protein [Rhizohabitans arisaemae]